MKSLQSSQFAHPAVPVSKKPFKINILLAIVQVIRLW
jgi:hypothetical protein